MNGNVSELSVLSGTLLKKQDRYYQAYLEFFKAEVKTKSFDMILEEYIFAPNANFVEGATKQPEMLNRFFAALIHPLIHTGLGVEFNLPGIFAEGKQIYIYIIVQPILFVTEKNSSMYRHCTNCCTYFSTKSYANHYFVLVHAR